MCLFDTILRVLKKCVIYAYDYHKELAMRKTEEGKVVLDLGKLQMCVR